MNENIQNKLQKVLQDILADLNDPSKTSTIESSARIIRKTSTMVRAVLAIISSSSIKIVDVSKLPKK